MARERQQRRDVREGRTSRRGAGGIVEAYRRLNQTRFGRFLSSVVLALLVVIPVRTFAIQGYHIPSGSMEKTLLIGDVLFADKITFGPKIPFTHGARLPGFRKPQPGDIVIFRSPRENRDLIKRCVAVEGQVVEMRAKQLFVDGEPVDEPYVQHTDPNYDPWRDDFGPFKVPKGHIFVLGDNRDNSKDSRFLGPIPLENVIAKARIIYFSIDTRTWRPRLWRIGKLL
jgi:signal peptidase I